MKKRSGMILLICSLALLTAGCGPMIVLGTAALGKSTENRCMNEEVAGEKAGLKGRALDRHLIKNNCRTYVKNSR